MEQDWQEIQDFLIGVRGLREVDAYKVTFVEYRAYLKAYREEIERGWEYTRFISWVTHSVSQLKQQYKFSSPEKFMPLECDRRRKKVMIDANVSHQLSPEQEVELFRIMSKIRNKKTKAN